ncbi:DUF3604 domain-containing protein [Candidatus Dojkabacteria bacterium]|uniref:DUF3604 domain-containing protein n=1 Tax=Candidatus Dojkabacteria bacterium TaxID=2099670 RepID=A0A955RJ20_9BACT|nr:DUF3604 domain-containing protein [Candidatus Dojkabacteria bacterium]
MKNIYSKEIATAKIDIKTAVAGKHTDAQLDIKIGKYGIADGGAIKVLFRISADVDDVEFTDSSKENYVSIKSDAKVDLQGYSRSNGLKGKVHARPWTNGFVVFIKGGYLLPNENISIEFKNFRMQTIVEDTFEFKILIDAFSTGEYLEIEKSPEIEVLPDIPAMLTAVIPTTVAPLKEFKALVKIEDKWGNPCTQLNDEIEIVNFKELGLKDSKQKLKKGKSEIKLSLESGVYDIQAKYKTLSAKSNYVVIKESKLKQYWADLHGQSEETVGTNNIEHYVNFAKEYGFLDVISSQANDFQVDNKFWDKTKKLSTSNSINGEFIMFPGYEWSGNSGRGGDRNVIFNETNPPIYKSSFAQTLHEYNKQNEALTAKDLFKKLKKHNALTIAHVGGRYANLEMHDDDVEPLIEVHSDWGTFEWFLQDALEKGYKVGISAASDNHNSRPGASYPGLEEFTSYGGLTCILSEQLTPDSIFEAIKARHTYATTGHRAYIDAKCTIGDKQYLIGDQVTNWNSNAGIELNYLGTSPIQKIELFNKSKLIKTHLPEIDETHIKLSWHGTEFYGRNREYKWSGSGEFTQNKIVDVSEVNFYHHSKFKHSVNKFEFSSLTSGNYKGVNFKLDKPFEKLKLLVNDTEFEISKKDINKPFSLNEYSEVEVSYLAKEKSVQEISWNFEIASSQLNKGDALYFKVTQEDGGIAWTSPFYIV